MQRVGSGCIPCAKTAEDFLEESSFQKFCQERKCQSADMLPKSAAWLPQVRINIHALVQDAHNQALILGLHLENNQMPTLPKFEHVVVP